MPEVLDHDAEVAQQADIAAQVEAAAVVAPAAPAVVVADVQLRSVNVETYPLHVTVVGSEELTFVDASTVLTVPAAVAEQTKYLPNVEVVA